MDLKKDLMSLGLNEKETQIYLTCLQLGIDTVLHIAKQAGLKRPTVYLILEELERRGLVSKTKKGNKLFFRSETPDRLLEDLNAKEKQLRRLLPSLHAIHNISPEKPNIRIAEGVEGVKNVYRNIFAYLSAHPAEELIIFGSLKDAAFHFEREVVNYFYVLMRQSNNLIREIGNDDAITRKYYRHSRELNPRHEIRFIKNDGQFLQTDNMIYGNTLVIFSVREQIFATTIESSNIAATYRTLFNMAWRSGKMI